MEHHATCRYDVLEIHKGVSTQGDLVGRYCNNKPPRITMDDGVSIFIVFKTDGSVVYRGFKVIVEGYDSTGDENSHDGGDGGVTAATECGTPEVYPNLANTPTHTGRIIGGDDAIQNSWPWQVSLRLYAGTFHTCGGSILSPEWVITAAHCVDSGNTASFKVCQMQLLCFFLATLSV